MAIFGRRAVQAKHGAPQRVISEKFWSDPETAPFLTRLGLAPDDPENIVPTPDVIDQRLEAAKIAMQGRLETAMQRAASKVGQRVEMRPFFLFSGSCWEKERGHFLTATLELTPFDDWNVAFVAADRATAKRIGMVYHPGVDIPGYVQVGERKLDEQAALLSAAHKQAGLTHDFAAYGAARETAISQIKATAAGLFNHWKANC